MLRWLSAGLTLLSLALGAPGWAVEMPRVPLDAWWEGHMLAGRAASYHDGSEFLDAAPPRHGSFESADGVPDRAWATTRGIRAQDFRETRLLGFLRWGGWRLEGGLLARVGVGQETIELYGRSVWETEPVLLRIGWSLPRSAKHSYDFFLLRRVDGVARAAVVKKWTIPADQVPRDYHLRGALACDAATRVATVTLTGVEDRRLFANENVPLEP